MVDKYQSSSTHHTAFLMQHLTVDDREVAATQIQEEEEPHFDTSLQRQQTPVLEL
jgi:hypothetical protein